MIRIKLKVLILSAANNVHTVRWVNALAERGLEVHLAFLPNHAPSVHHQIIDKVVLHPLRFSGSLGYYLNSLQLNMLYRNIQPDIVNAHYASGYGTLARIARLKTLLVSAWGSDVYDFPYINRFTMRTIKQNLYYADALASTSNCMAQQIEKLVSGKRIFITPFGVNSSDFRSNKSTKYPRNSTVIKIGNIKTLKPKYGIDNLIKATYILQKNLVENGHRELSLKIRVEIYGEGPQRNELEKLITELNLGGVVALKGTIPNIDVPSILATFDIFCATSSIDSESFGVAVVEAMAASVPVVVTDVDGFKEVTDSGKAGVIVKRNEPENVAIALKSIILNPNLQKRLAKAARNRVLEQYEWNDNVTSMIDAYKMVYRMKKK